MDIRGYNLYCVPVNTWTDVVLSYRLSGIHVAIPFFILGKIGIEMLVSYLTSHPGRATSVIILFRGALWLVVITLFGLVLYT